MNFSFVQQYATLERRSTADRAGQPLVRQGEGRNLKRSLFGPRLWTTSLRPQRRLLRMTYFGGTLGPSAVLR